MVRLLKGQKLTKWVTRLTGQKLSHAISAKVAHKFSSLVAGRTIGLSELKLLSGLAIHCLYQSEELESDHSKAADMVWSLQVYRLECSVAKSDEPMLCYLLNGTASSFVW